MENTDINNHDVWIKQVLENEEIVYHIQRRVGGFDKFGLAFSIAIGLYAPELTFLLTPIFYHRFFVYKKGEIIITKNKIIIIDMMCFYVINIRNVAEINRFTDGKGVYGDCFELHKGKYIKFRLEGNENIYTKEKNIYEVFKKIKDEDNKKYGYKIPTDYKMEIHTVQRVKYEKERYERVISGQSVGAFLDPVSMSISKSGGLIRNTEFEYEKRFDKMGEFWKRVIILSCFLYILLKITNIILGKILT